MEQTRQYPPVRRRRRRRRRLNYRFLVLLAVLAAGIALVIWAVSGNDSPEPSPTDPVRTTQAPTDPTEPTPPPTEPPPPTAEETISAFAAQHGLTLEAYPEKLIELYKPKYLLHGHVHLRYNAHTGQKPRRENEYRGTKVINVSDRYELEIDDAPFDLKNMGQIIWKTKHKD